MKRFCSIPFVLFTRLSSSDPFPTINTRELQGKGVVKTQSVVSSRDDSSNVPTTDRDSAAVGYTEHTDTFGFLQGLSKEHQSLRADLRSLLIQFRQSRRNRGPFVDRSKEGSANNTSLEQMAASDLSKLSETEQYERRLARIESARRKLSSELQSYSVFSPRFNPDDHVLLSNLDVDADAVLFGNNREEFYENVQKMRRVIVEHHAWERTDRLYLWATRLIKLILLGALAEWYMNDASIKLYASEESKREYREYLERAQQAREQLWEQHVEEAVMAIRAHPPNFESLQQTKDTSIEQQRPEKSLVGQLVDHPMDTEGEARELYRQQTQTFGTTHSFAHSPLSVPLVAKLRRILLPQSEDATALVYEEMAEYQRAKAEAAPIGQLPKEESTQTMVP